MPTTPRTRRLTAAPKPEELDGPQVVEFILFKDGIVFWFEEDESARRFADRLNNVLVALAFDEVALVRSIVAKIKELEQLTPARVKRVIVRVAGRAWARVNLGITLDSPFVC